MWVNAFEVIRKRYENRVLFIITSNRNFGRLGKYFWGNGVKVTGIIAANWCFREPFFPIGLGERFRSLIFGPNLML